tara:strand:+ start:528 stop:1625 length:1098 start_codon:yes stop_codon:yes gene_type:complete
MEIFTNWLNNLVAKPSFHSLIKKIPIIRRLAFNDGKIIYDLVAGFVYSQVLLAIIELRLIDFLITGKKKIDDISRFTGLPHDKCILLCNAAASVGLLKKNKDSTYRLTRIGAAIKGVSGLDKMILHHKMFYRDLIDPVKLLNKNFNTELKNFWTYVPSNKKITKEEAKTYSELMGISQHIVAEETLNLVNLNPFKSLLDLGGGNGTFILEVRRRYPNLILNVFDLPSVIETAKSKISHLGDKSKIKLIPGNFIEDKLPDGNDIIFLNRVLYDHNDTNVELLIKKIYDALSPGGHLVISEPMAGNEKPTRSGDAYFGFYTLAMTSGKPRSKNQHFKILKKSGFMQLKFLQGANDFVTSVILAKKNN